MAKAVVEVGQIVGAAAAALVIAVAKVFAPLDPSLIRLQKIQKASRELIGETRDRGDVGTL